MLLGNSYRHEYSERRQTYRNNISTNISKVYRSGSEAENRVPNQANVVSRR